MPIKALLLMLTYVLCVHAFITKCIVYPLFAHPFVPAWYNMLSNMYLTVHIRLCHAAVVDHQCLKLISVLLFYAGSLHCSLVAITQKADHAVAVS